MMPKKLIIRLSLVLVAGCAMATPVSQNAASETDSQTDMDQDEDTQTGADTDFEGTDMEDTDSAADSATDTDSESEDSESALSDTDSGSEEESYFSTCQRQAIRHLGDGTMRMDGADRLSIQSIQQSRRSIATGLGRRLIRNLPNRQTIRHRHTANFWEDRYILCMATARSSLGDTVSSANAWNNQAVCSPKIEDNVCP